MKKRMTALLLAFCMVFGPASTAVAAPGDNENGEVVQLSDEIHTPSSMKITACEACITKVGENQNTNLYLCNDSNMETRGGKLSFSVTDQDGRDISQYVTWRSDQPTWLSFADGTVGTATVAPQSAGNSQEIVITAHFEKEGERPFEAAYILKVVPKMSLSHQDLRELSEYEKNGLVLPGNGESASWSMKSKFRPADYITYDLFDMTLEGKAEMKRPSSGHEWVDGSVCYPGIHKVVFTEKGDVSNTVTLTVPVSGVAVEDKDGNLGTTTMEAGATGRLTAYTATAEENFKVYQGEDAAVQWSSSDEEIASVDENGFVTAKKEGTAVITAQDTVFGVGETEGYKGSIQVRVLADTSKAYVNDLGISFGGQNNIYTTKESAAGTSSAGRENATATYGSLKRALVFGYEGNFTGDADRAECREWFLRYRTSETLLNVETSFSGDVTVELWHNGTFVQQLESGVAASVRPAAGENRIELKTKFSDGTGVNDSYSYNLFLVTSPTNRIGTVKLSSDDRALSDTLMYNGKQEGTAFVSTDGVPGTSTSLTGASVKEFMSFVSKDVTSVNAALTSGDKLYGRIAYKLSEDGAVVKEGVASLETDELEFGNEDELTIYVMTMPALTYLENSVAGDPWAAQTGVNTYKYIIRRMPYRLENLGVTEFSLGESGTASAFEPSSAILSGIVNGAAETADIRFKFSGPETALAYQPKTLTGTINASTTQYVKNDDGWYSYEMTTLAGDTLKFYTIYLAIQFEDETSGIVVRRNYTVSLIQGSKNAVNPALLPTSLTEYLCMAGRHTNLPGGPGSYDMDLDYSAFSSGLGAERTLFGYIPSTFTAGAGYMGLMGKKEETLVSLGNFGGNVTYYFADGIQNDPGNPYGVDFIVYGYANAVKGEEAVNRISNAAVYVSENGTDWYELAGSEHYDEAAVWNYTISYTQGASGADYSDSLGRSGSIGKNYGFPSAANYPLYKGNYSFTGTLLQGSNSIGESLAGSPRDAAWGYHGLRNAEGDVYSAVPNPYTETDNLGSGFDISWAVGTDGLPVSLNNVKYVKVMSNNLLTGNNDDDNSPVVGGIVKTVSTAVTSVLSEEEVGITVDGKQLKLEADKKVYQASVSGENFTVSVNAPDDAKVYINNMDGTSRTYNGNFDFNKGIVRVVVQTGNSEAKIYYIQIADPLSETKASAKTELSEYKNADDYREEQKAELEKAIEAGNVAIEAAGTVEEVKAALVSAKEALDAIKTDEQLTAEEVSEAKASAKTELSEYKNTDDYREEQKAELENAIEAGNVAIEAAETVEEVKAALVSAKEALDAIKTNEQLTAEEILAAKTLKEAKDRAKADLDNYKDMSKYREAQKKELVEAIEAGKKAIDKATTLEETAEAFEMAKAVMDAVKTDEQLKKEETQMKSSTSSQNGKSVNTAVRNSSHPATGDDSNYLLYAVLCIAALAMLFVTVAAVRKRK